MYDQGQVSTSLFYKATDGKRLYNNILTVPHMNIKRPLNYNRQSLLQIESSDGYIPESNLESNTAYRLPAINDSVYDPFVFNKRTKMNPIVCKLSIGKLKMLTDLPWLSFLKPALASIISGGGSNIIQQAAALIIPNLQSASAVNAVASQILPGAPVLGNPPSAQARAAAEAAAAVGAEAAAVAAAKATAKAAAEAKAAELGTPASEGSSQWEDPSPFDEKTLYPEGDEGLITPTETYSYKPLPIATLHPATVPYTKTQQDINKIRIMRRAASVRNHEIFQKNFHIIYGYQDTYFVDDHKADNLRNNPDFDIYYRNIFKVMNANMVYSKANLTFEEFMMTRYYPVAGFPCCLEQLNVLVFFHMDENYSIPNKMGNRMNAITGYVQEKYYYTTGAFFFPLQHGTNLLSIVDVNNHVKTYGILNEFIEPIYSTYNRMDEKTISYLDETYMAETNYDTFHNDSNQCIPMTLKGDLYFNVIYSTNTDKPQNLYTADGIYTLVGSENEPFFEQKFDEKEMEKERIGVKTPTGIRSPNGSPTLTPTGEKEQITAKTGNNPPPPEGGGGRIAINETKVDEPPEQPPIGVNISAGDKPLPPDLQPIPIYDQPQNPPPPINIPIYPQPPNPPPLDPKDAPQDYFTKNFKDIELSDDFWKNYKETLFPISDVDVEHAIQTSHITIQSAQYFEDEIIEKINSGLSKSPEYNQTRYAYAAIIAGSIGVLGLQTFALRHRIFWYLADIAILCGMNKVDDLSIFLSDRAYEVVINMVQGGFRNNDLGSAIAENVIATAREHGFSLFATAVWNSVKNFITDVGVNLAPFIVNNNFILKDIALPAIQFGTLFALGALSWSPIMIHNKADNKAEIIKKMNVEGDTQFAQSVMNQSIIMNATIGDKWDFDQLKDLAIDTQYLHEVYNDEFLKQLQMPQKKHNVFIGYGVHDEDEEKIPSPVNEVVITYNNISVNPNDILLDPNVNVNTEKAKMELNIIKSDQGTPFLGLHEKSPSSIALSPTFIALEQRIEEENRLFEENQKEFFRAYQKYYGAYPVKDMRTQTLLWLKMGKKFDISRKERQGQAKLEEKELNKKGIFTY